MEDIRVPVIPAESGYKIVRGLYKGVGVSIFIVSKDDKKFILKLFSGIRDEREAKFKKEYECLKSFVSPICDDGIYCFIEVLKLSPREYFYHPYGLVIEYLENYVTLQEFILSMEIDENSLKILEKIKSDIIKAVLKIHSQGIYHTDLHFKNIMVNKDTYQVKIIDFGMCERHDSIMKNKDFINLSQTFKKYLEIFKGHMTPEITKRFLSEINKIQVE